MRFAKTISPQIRELAGKKAGARLTALVCRQLLEALIAENRILIRLHRLHGVPIPPLYKSGVVYGKEPWRGKIQDLADLGKVRARGWGDCKHLVAWRVAELREAGRDAYPLIYWRFDRTGAPYIYHAELRHGAQFGQGEREDPSRFLGM